MVSEQPTSEIVREMGRCVHFNGIIHDRCKAGVAYDDVRGAVGSVPRGIPCLKERANGTTCASAAFPTQEQAAAAIAADRQRVEAYFAAIKAGRCPLCDTAIELRQVGRCVYGSCGHRLYHGTVPKR